MGEYFSLRKPTQNPISINFSCRLRLERVLKEKAAGTVVADILETNAVAEILTVTSAYLCFMWKPAGEE